MRSAAAGELFFIGYNLNKSKSSIHYAGMDPQGNIMFDQRIALPNPVMHHDFAITQDYALLVHHCLESNGEVSNASSTGCGTSVTKHCLCIVHLWLPWLSAVLQFLLMQDALGRVESSHLLAAQAVCPA